MHLEVDRNFWGAFVLGESLIFGCVKVRKNGMNDKKRAFEVSKL